MMPNRAPEATKVKTLATMHGRLSKNEPRSLSASCLSTDSFVEDLSAGLGVFRLGSNGSVIAWFGAVEENDLQLHA